MKMVDAKKEIESKLFVGTPLSLDAMICALTAINEYINTNGPESFVTLNVNVDEEVERTAKKKLDEELQKGLDSGEKDGWVTMDDVKRHLGLDEN